MKSHPETPQLLDDYSPDHPGSLYLNHFGLTDDPFNVTPDPRFLYWSAGHSEALAQLTYGITARKGFVVLTGEIGTGKTTLVHALLEELRKKGTYSAWISKTIVSPRDLLHYVCEDFGIPGFTDCKELPDYLRLLNRFLLESYQSGVNVALIIDEAQNLPDTALESIRVLSNFETTQHKLLQILLIGQPELTTRLNSPALRQLKQRVVLRHHLWPLSYPECVEYIARRLQLVGGKPSIFSQEAIETVYFYSEGTPRLINILCDNGMLSAYAMGTNRVDSETIREIACDLCLVPGTERLGHTRDESKRNDHTKEDCETEQVPFTGLTNRLYENVNLDRNSARSGQSNGSYTAAETNYSNSPEKASSVDSNDSPLSVGYLPGRYWISITIIFAVIIYLFIL